MSRIAMGLLAVASLSVSSWLIGAAPSPSEQRAKALQAMKAGNFKDAYELFRPLALDPKDGAKEVVADLRNSISCLSQLGRVDEIDAFREGMIAAHVANWQLLQAAAQSYASTQHYGFIVAGQFYRGNKRGGGKYVSAEARDRVRALQLMQQALPLVAKEPNKAQAAQFHLDFAHNLANGVGYYEAWRLQYLTDLKTLPDYDENVYGYRGRIGYNNQTPGAPVDADGNPIYYHVPASFDKAANDGERWRWLLQEVVELQSSRLNEVRMILAGFFQSQFGEQTMAGQSFGPASDESTKKNTSGTYALNTLSDSETIARLATGIKRFKLPDEFNYLLIFKQVADAVKRSKDKTVYGEQARDAVAQVYENRRQYVKAAEAWKLAIQDYGDGPQGQRRKRLDQIIGNWGRFEPTSSSANGMPATVDFRYRNGKKVHFEARAIKVSKLLSDVKDYLKSNPPRLDGQKLNISNIGYRLVQLNEAKYVGDKVAAWDLNLRPRPEHVDDRITVTTPLQKAGAYLVTATMDNGNVSRIVLWLNDSIIVKKTLKGQVLYYLADARTGEPIAKANVDFFGWRQQPVQPRVNQYQVVTESFAQPTDADGQVIIDGSKQGQNFQWLVTATTGTGRFAYLGFTYVWNGQYYDYEYNQTKVFTITDRPVYRPLQTVHFKVWIQHAQYDQEDKAFFANRAYPVTIYNPKGEKVLEKTFTTDAYGGLEGDLPLAKEATLGVYHVQVGNPNIGGGMFRVEEYKKPEFEVKVEAPKEPVRLGETITATIHAKYYFGAAVTNAKVKYKVLRTNHDAHWYPLGRWDWLYGSGYWWFASDYVWYPGWSAWGCARPIPIWWGRPNPVPEVVAENEVQIGDDGTVKVTINTEPAKELHGDHDHQYTITAEVTDESRRTIVGTGNVLVARKPFKVHAWVDRGHYRVGDTIQASFAVFTPDQKPVAGKGELVLYQIRYDEKHQPVEKEMMKWALDPDAEGHAKQKLDASEAGQYRLSYKVTDAQKHTIEGGYVFIIRGQGFDGKEFRFNDLELVTDKREYAPGEKVKLLVNANRAGGAVLLFIRPANGVYLPPKVIRLKGKSVADEIAVVKKDMPNFFIEALRVADGKVFTEVREVVVPPEKRVLNVDIEPSQKEYLPGAEAKVRVKLTDMEGRPFVGSTVLSVYDRSVDYIAGGSNVPEIKSFFWQWRRHHHPQTESNAQHQFGNLLKRNEIAMGDLGIFGATAVEEYQRVALSKGSGLGGIETSGRRPGGMGFGGAQLKTESAALTAPMSALAEGRAEAAKAIDGVDKNAAGEATPPPNIQVPSVRSNFADTAFWSGALTTDKDGIAEVAFRMPENLTGWKVKAWAMGLGTKVGQGEADVVTRKNIIVRLQAPRFFVERDEVTLSANVHNYLKTDKSVTVKLELDGGTLETVNNPSRQIVVKAGTDQRVDWCVKVLHEGKATVRMKALTDVESDAMEMQIPVYVHGMLKMESFSGVIRPDKSSGIVKMSVPEQRRINDSRIEVQFSPTLAGAMVDALPYLADYPYGCTEQTLNRFLPTVITQNVLKRMNLNLKDIRDKRTNLNAQELGDPKERAKGWKRFEHNAVFDDAEVQAMAKAGLDRLTQMQLSDGGWGWFSGWGEQSYPHTTAVVVHGLQIAKQNGMTLPPGMLEKGIAWLKNYQSQEVQKIKNAPAKIHPWKEHADNLDAFVYMVLIDQDVAKSEMMEFLYRDRVQLSVYGKALFGLALQQQKQADKLAMILRNIEQFLVQDEENQTAYLRLPNDNPWWYWYGSETEAQAAYLKLLARTDPKGEKASRLVKYLLNNRKHATYWNSTRDTALAIEAMAEYLKASGEDRPDLTIEVWIDGQKMKETHVDADNLFTFDNRFVLFGDAVTTGQHTVELRKRGNGPLYYNAYLTNFTLEDFITKAGLEVKINRKYYLLTPVDKKVKIPGSRGQALDQKVEKYERSELPNLSAVKSGDLVEVELEIDSKNDYEYLMFEDMKAAGFEPVAVRSGYTRDGLGAYMEVRDERVCFFVRWLARGKHSINYRLRAEIPGTFSALPARAAAMYTPELKGNSDEIRLVISD